MTSLIFGCGYLGQRVAKLWLSENDEVFVVTRDLSKADRFRERGLKPIVGDLARNECLPALPVVDRVLFAVGNDRISNMPIRSIYVDGLRNALNAFREPPKSFVYISSTGVYGQKDGSWVDEESPAEPVTEGGTACRAAEELLRSSAIGPASVILRLAGIYGPRRVPRSKELLEGTPLVLDPDSWLNLIHVEDAAAIASLASRKSATPNLFVVSDGSPVPRGEYFTWLCSRLGAPSPTFVARNESSSPRRGDGSKRVRNTKLLSQLGYSFLYPSFRDGMEQAISAEKNNTS